MARDPGYYERLLDRSMLPHKWLLCADVATVFTTPVRQMREKGAPRPLVLAGSLGTGKPPSEEDCDLVVLGTSAETMLGGIRAYHDAIDNLPAWALERIEEWDPDHEARVLSSFLHTAGVVAGRPVWAAKPESWAALEDKIKVHEIWDAAGVTQSSWEVVPSDAPALIAAAHRQDAGSGTVWAADNKEGWHGGAEYVRYVADPDDAGDSLAFMKEHADRVRVMPFLEGVPCSIHGMVFADAVATFRPVEMVVFRMPGSDRFRYAATATTWDPPDDTREEMRAAARRVGAHLRDLVGFRGAFTMDGVATSGGFLPTELNPRFGSGLGAIGRSAGVPLLGVSRLLMAGEDDGLDAAELEELVVTAADATRHLGGFTVLEGALDETEELRIAWDGSSFEVAAEGEGNASLSRGPAAMGSSLRFTVDAGQAPPGTFAAPVVAAAFRFADDIWGTGIGELIPATRV